MGNKVTYYNEKGIKRFFNAILFSLAGLKVAWTHEEAFRQEVIVLIIAIPLAIWLDKSNIETLMLIGSIIFVLIVEILNTGIEAVVDRAGFEYHEFSERAKDLGSAAVMLSILMSISTWILILI